MPAINSALRARWLMRRSSVFIYLIVMHLSKKVVVIHRNQNYVAGTWLDPLMLPILEYVVSSFVHSATPFILDVPGRNIL